MNVTDSGTSTATSSAPRNFKTAALGGIVLLAIGGGVLLTMWFHSPSTSRPLAGSASAGEVSRSANGGDAKDRSLETVGSLTAALLYQGYLNIGLLADARESDVYTGAESEKLLDSVSRMLDAVDRRLSRMLEDSLKREDREAVEHAQQLGDSLRGQARELRAFWRTGEKQHADNFQKARQEAWSGIQEVLGIED